MRLAGLSVTLLISAVLAPAGAQTLPSLQLKPEDREKLSSRETVFVREFQFSGNMVFTRKQLMDVPVVMRTESGKDIAEKKVSDFINREITFDDLEQIRVGLTLFYVNRGYINSGAVIPDQNAENGVIKIEIVEGVLSDINIRGNKRLKAKYYTDRIRYGAAGPLDINKLRDQLEIVRQNPNIERINAQLHPGDSPGQSYLDVDVEERDTNYFAISFNNHRSPSVGSERFELFYANQNLLGFGDALAIRYGLTSGGIHDMKIAGADHWYQDIFPFTNPKDFTVDYTIPISPSGTTLGFEVSKTDEVVIEEPFQDLDIGSETTSFDVTLRQPIYRSTRSELAVFVTGAIRRNETALLGDGFAFPPDVDNGVSDVTIIRFGQEFFTRDTQQALAIRSTLSFGLNAFGATNNDRADGQFVAWLGQLQYIRKIGQTDMQWVYRLNAQFATDSLLALEQFAVGGVDSVRGYRENQLVRDNGITSQLELRIPVINRKPGESILEIAPFVDVGYGYNANGEPTGELLSSVGLGLLFHPFRKLDAEVYWGHPFKDFDNDGHDAQDYGFHFNVTWQVF
jgi:hemolysin activation/secretion protein